MTRRGEITLNNPDFRDITSETTVFKKYSRVERAVINTIPESYIQGVFNWKIQSIISQFGKVQESLTRSLEQPIPYLIVDATYLKVRQRCHYVNQAVLLIAGVREDGYREILGIKVVDREDEGIWSSLFEEPKERGLCGLQLVIPDGRKGIRNAVIRKFLGAGRQLCHVHFIRAFMRNLPKKGISCGGTDSQGSPG